jgi:pimeloyl-ACP methyl ester carboxylesterase
LGEINHPVSTTNAEAQGFFNQGLAYLYGFNHDEAVRSFKRAAELDPQLAMAYWGMSLAQGSNYNLQAEGPQLLEAYGNLQKAITLGTKAPENERAYIDALSKRYSADLRADQLKLAADYKNAMGELAKRYPDDLDAATLYAESMMNLRPWKLWTLDGKPAEGTLEIVAVLEGVLRRNPNHTGANHYYIHAVEASQNAERALPSADRLGRLAPKAGHLVHMPSHVYIRTGDYNEAANSNADAIVADREYMNRTGVKGVYTMMYYNHNIHFLASVNAMKGRYGDALKAAKELEASVQPNVKAMPMLEMFMPYTTVTLVRFGKWDEILKAPKPAAELKITTAFWHYAKGTAYLALNQVPNAETEYRALQEVIKTVPADTPMGNNVAVDVLKVADQVLAGKIAFVRGDKNAAFDLFVKAVAAEDRVAYNEPPDWDLPVREVYGAALLLSGEAAKAEQVFRAEIAKHQRNGRALFGLMESLKRQGKDSSARMVQVEFEKAWATADTKLTVEELGGIAPRTTSASSVNQATNLEFADVRLKTGVTLHYGQQGDANGQVMILLHGYTDSWFSYSRVLSLIDAKNRVYVLDQRGHGRSERPASGYELRSFAEDVVAFMDAKGVSKATVVGHSMGSFVAQHVATLAPERVSRLVLVGSATTPRNNVVSELQQAVNALGETVPEKFITEFQTSTIFHKVPEPFIRQIVLESQKVPARVWREVIAGLLNGNSGANLKSIKTHTMIIWGDRESIFPRSEQDALVQTLENSDLKVYTDTGHSPHWERPEQFARDLQEFLSRST